MTCWWIFWHHWEKWQTVEEGKIIAKPKSAPLTGEPIVFGKYEYQRRVCLLCGKSEMREVNA